MLMLPLASSQQHETHSENLLNIPDTVRRSKWPVPAQHCSNMMGATQVTARPSYLYLAYPAHLPITQPPAMLLIRQQRRRSTPLKKLHLICWSLIARISSACNLACTYSKFFCQWRTLPSLMSSNPKHS